MQVRSNPKALLLYCICYIRSVPCLSRGCRLFYQDGKWETEEDGSDKYCRWCGNGGELICCDVCPKAFCKRCLQRNLGRKFFSNITSAEDWKCLACDFRQIYKFRAEYYVYSKHLRDQQKAQERSAPRSAIKRTLDKAGPADNFVDEHIHTAFKTLATYQKALDNQRKAWAKSGKEASAEKVAPVCKALRKVFLTTRKNMDLLDEALVESFEAKFPSEKRLIKVYSFKNAHTDFFVYL